MKKTMTEGIDEIIRDLVLLKLEHEGDPVGAKLNEAITHLETFQALRAKSAAAK